jgi:DNA-binding NarL/FixJ family response regulator
MKTVVLVEDHELMREGLRAFFARRGDWAVAEEAASLAETEALFEKFDRDKRPLPDLVILDLELGDSWGPDIITMLKQRYGKTAPRIVVYSAYTDYVHVKAAMRAGAAGYVCKSRRAEELERAMVKVLEGESAVDPDLVFRITTVSDMMLGLTKRERQVFELVQTGRDNRQIAETLGISPRTVENNLSVIYDKTGIKSRAELAGL